MEAIQITRSPAQFIGVVYAADEQAAKATAIEQFEITKPHEQKKLMVRRHRLLRMMTTWQQNP